MASDAARVEYWDYKLETWEVYQQARPNAVHHAIASLERAGKILAVVTQNVDGLHRRAGTSPDLLVEVHGTDLLVECQTCHATSDPAPHFARFKTTRQAPHCECGGVLKSATISFGQPLRPADLERAAAAAVKADLVLALGSTLSVYPAASIPLLAPSGAYLTSSSTAAQRSTTAASVTLRIEGDVTAVVPAAVDAALDASRTAPVRKAR